MHMHHNVSPCITLHCLQNVISLSPPLHQRWCDLTGLSNWWNCRKVETRRSCWYSIDIANRKVAKKSNVGRLLVPRPLGGRKVMPSCHDIHPNFRCKSHISSMLWHPPMLQVGIKKEEEEEEEEGWW